MSILGIDYTVLCTGTSQEKTFGAQVAREFGLSSQLGEILYNRGIVTPEQAHAYLYPEFSSLPSPDAMKGMREAVACIVEGYRSNKPVFIHGDYDVDGITATSLLVDFFREIGWEYYYYIPNRLKEGYGLSIDSIDRLLAQCASKKGVVISVDCGITAIREVEYIRQLGHQMIITDHHEPQENLPQANALLNPKQKGCLFSCSYLSGVGVAFYLLLALRKALSVKVNLKKYLDLVALGTVADVMPLIGANRVLVRAGLEVLSTRGRIGIASLCRQSGIEEGRDILTEDIAFKLAPRINASGRLGCPQKGVELLVAEHALQAEQAAFELDRMNIHRKELESSALPEIDERCVTLSQARAMGLVVYQHDCHPGVLGILASRIAERYNRPTLVFTDDAKSAQQGYIKGSGRSIKEVDLFQAITKCSGVIEQFGGHAMAVGVTLKKCNLAEFSLRLNNELSQLNMMLSATAPIAVDYAMTGNRELSQDLARSLQWMQPFGEGNAEPIFMLPGQKILAPRIKNSHVMFQLQGKGKLFRGIGFNLARPDIDLARPAHLIFQLKRSWYRGNRVEQIVALKIISH